MISAATDAFAAWIPRAGRGRVLKSFASTGKAWRELFPSNGELLAQLFALRKSSAG